MSSDPINVLPQKKDTFVTVPAMSVTSAVSVTVVGWPVCRPKRAPSSGEVRLTPAVGNNNSCGMIMAA